MKPIVVLAVLLSSLISPIVVAQEASPETLSIQLERDERLRRESFQDDQQRQQEQRGFKPTVVPKPKPPTGPSGNQFRFNVNTITLSGDTLIDPIDKRKILAEYEASVLSLDQINHLIAELTNWYIAKGYITTRAYATPQNIQDGDLQVTIVEGRIEGFILNGKPLPWQWGMLRTQAPGDILNLRQLEQSVQHLNRLRSVGATVSIQPGTKPGYSIVVFQTRVQGSPYASTFAYDTYTDTQVDLYPKSARFSFENITGLWESSTVSLSQGNEGGGQNSHSVGMNTQVPFRNYMLSGSFNQFEYTQFIESGFGQNVLSGRSKSASAQLERYFARTQAGHLSWFLDLNVSSKRNTVDRVRTPSSTYKLADISAGLRHFSRKGARSFSSTTKIKVGNKDNSRLSVTTSGADQPQTHFYALHYNANYNAPFPVIGLPLQFSSSINAQWTRKVLHTERQLALASHYSVRGLRDPSESPPAQSQSTPAESSSVPEPVEGPSGTQTQANGERGLIIRNELTFQLARTLPKAPFKYLQPYIHLDAGMVFDNLRDLSRQDDDKSGAVSVGAGVKLNYRALHLNATLSRTVYRTQELYNAGWVKAMSFQFMF